MSIFYRPGDGFVGDLILFFWQGMHPALHLRARFPLLRKGADGAPYGRAQAMSRR